MAKNKRTEMEIMQDKAFISELLLKGKGPTEIALSLNRRRSYNLSETQIRYDIDKIKKEWKTTYLTNYNLSRAQELAKINKLETEYWEAWARSRRNKRKVTIDETQMEGSGNFDGHQNQEKRKEIIEHQIGNPKYLKGIQWCIDKRCKILGLDSPMELELSWREKAKEHNLDPDKVVADLERQFVEAAEKGLEKAD